CRRKRFVGKRRNHAYRARIHLRSSNVVISTSCGPPHYLRRSGSVLRFRAFRRVHRPVWYRDRHTRAYTRRLVRLPSGRSKVVGLGLDHLYFVFGVPLPLNSTLDETFTFNPIPALGPGESASSPFTMTGTLVTPSGILTSVNGIGILTVFCCDA